MARCCRKTGHGTSSARHCSFSTTETVSLRFLEMRNRDDVLLLRTANGSRRTEFGEALTSGLLDSAKPYGAGRASLEIRLLFFQRWMSMITMLAKPVTPRASFRIVNTRLQLLRVQATDRQQCNRKQGGAAGSSREVMILRKRCQSRANSRNCG